jgi:hypothetical protein
MKQLILSALLCVAFHAHSQEILFTDSSKISQVVSAIVAEVPAFHFVRVDSSRSKESFSHIYSDSTHTMKINFAIWKMGGNKDLELPDTVYYQLASIIGPYKVLFPYWKKYYQPEADLISLQADGHGKVFITPFIGKKYFVCTLTKSNGWWITYHMY